jgi:MarR family
MQGSQTEGFWTAVESELLACLRDQGPMTPAELGQRLDMSAAAASSLAAMLAADGKVRICLVELDTPPDERVGVPQRASVADR